MSRQIAVTTRSICLDPIRAYRQRLADYKPRPKIQSRNPRPARKTAIQVPNRKAWPRIEGMSSCRVAAYTRLIETTNGSEYHICAVCARSIGIAGGWVRGARGQVSGASVTRSFFGVAFVILCRSGGDHRAAPSVPDCEHVEQTGDHGEHRS